MRPSATRAVGEDRLPFINTRGRRNLWENFFSARKLISDDDVACNLLLKATPRLSDDAEELSLAELAGWSAQTYASFQSKTIADWTRKDFLAFRVFSLLENEEKQLKNKQQDDFSWVARWHRFKSVRRK